LDSTSPGEPLLLVRRILSPKDDYAHFDQAARGARMTEGAFLLEQADRCRRLAGALPATDPAAKTLTALAEEFEARAAALLDAASALKSKGAAEGGA
jgi:hypothetical protein